MTAEEILNELEAQMGEIFEFGGASFEQLEDYWALADTRLTTFRTDRLWALSIEAVRYDAGLEGFNLDIWIYGNCLKPRDWAPDLTRPLFAAPRAWNRQVDEWGFARDEFSILWRGKRHDFAPSLEELEATGVKLSRRERDSGVLTPPQMLRYVCAALDHPFFASEDILRDLLDARCFDVEWQSEGESGALQSFFSTNLGRFEEAPVLSCELELFLQTRDWRHPKWGGMDEYEISVRDAFEPLAQALAEGNLAPWQAQDAARFNSHWSFWAETKWQQEQMLEASKIALVAEGKRFQEFIKQLSAKEREAGLQWLKSEWKKSKRERDDMLRGRGNSMIFYGGAGVIEFGGQTFTLGPHLWGEEDDFSFE